MVDFWEKNEFEVIPLASLVKLKEFPDEDVVNTSDCDECVTYLRVTYEGFAEAGDKIPASETQYSKLYRVRSEDIVISNIAATHGSIAIVPERLDGCVVSTEYTVLEAVENTNPIIIWLLLRSPELRAEMLLTSTGISRSRVQWDNLKTIQIPKPSLEMIEHVVALTNKANIAMAKAQQLRSEAKIMLESSLDLATNEAFSILRAFKPPQ